MIYTCRRLEESGNGCRVQKMDVGIAEAFVTLAATKCNGRKRILLSGGGVLTAKSGGESCRIWVQEHLKVENHKQFL